MIKSHFVLNAALRDPNIASLPMLREQADPVRYLEEELKVESHGGLGNPQDFAQRRRSSGNFQDRQLHSGGLFPRSRRRRSPAQENPPQATRRRHQPNAGRRTTPAGANQAERRRHSRRRANPRTEPTLAVNQLIRFKEMLGKLESEIANWEAEKASVEKKLANVAEELSPPAGFLDSLDKDPKMMGLPRERSNNTTRRIDYLVKASGDAEPPIGRRNEAKGGRNPGRARTIQARTHRRIPERPTTHRREETQGRPRTRHEQSRSVGGAKEKTRSARSTSIKNRSTRAEEQAMRRSTLARSTFANEPRWSPKCSTRQTCCGSK